ncbi:hypothetical protein EX30DRAFT_340162 [Ascodesmis nigricans]|uniref:Uncharacterized protein n=1 Tax=Ascodesmis nigricans TaxID=341454 RepID=A0A4S2MZN2_9PEZI|nr:hypothetical protein EX30DRAFT_340162 [Ascodesmis nigricans]
MASQTSLRPLHDHQHQCASPSSQIHDLRQPPVHASPPPNSRVPNIKKTRPFKVRIILSLPDVTFRVPAIARLSESSCPREPRTPGLATTGADICSQQSKYTAIITCHASRAPGHRRSAGSTRKAQTAALCSRSCSRALTGAYHFAASVTNPCSGFISSIVSPDIRTPETHSTLRRCDRMGLAYTDCVLTVMVGLVVQS